MADINDEESLGVTHPKQIPQPLKHVKIEPKAWTSPGLASCSLIRCQRCQMSQIQTSWLQKLLKRKRRKNLLDLSELLDDECFFLDLTS